MRRYKTPEQLKAWRERHAELMAKREAEREEHERKMQQWADEHAAQGENVICPDNVVRKPSRYARLLDGKIQFDTFYYSKEWRDELTGR